MTNRNLDKLEFDKYHEDMAEFIGRKEELAFLQERYEANGFLLIILCDRRRIGITEAIL